MENINPLNHITTENFSEMHKLNPNDYHDAKVPGGTPITPKNNDKDNQKKQNSPTCNGKDCILSINDCSLPFFDDNGNFYCPSCSYNRAIAELEKTQKELMFAKRKTQLARKSVFLFLNSSKIPIVGEPPAENCGERVSVEIRGSNDHDTSAENQQDALIADKLVVVSHEGERNSGGNGDDLELVEFGSYQRYIVENENGNGNFGVQVAEKSAVSMDCEQSESMDDSEESSVSDDSEDSVDGFDNDLALLSQMFGKPQSQQIDEDTEMFQCARENENDRQPGVNFRPESSNAHHSCAEKDDLFANFRYDNSVVKKKVARRVTFSPEISIIPYEAAPNYTDAKCSKPARHLDASFRSESSTSHRRSAEKGDLFAEFRYHNPAAKSRNVASPEVSMISVETARNYHEAKRYKLSKHSTNPAIPDSRRKRLPWIYEEEEMLVESVKVFLLKGTKKLSWKSILEYGSRVFNRSRTPEDLRSKWKNMVREASREKPR